jgi:hypothetical protein
MLNYSNNLIELLESSNFKPMHYRSSKSLSRPYSKLSGAKFERPSQAHYTVKYTSKILNELDELEKLINQIKNTKEIIDILKSIDKQILKKYFKDDEINDILSFLDKRYNKLITDDNMIDINAFNEINKSLIEIMDKLSLELNDDQLDKIATWQSLI